MDKTAIFSVEAIDETASYPRAGIIRCEVRSRGIDDCGRDVVEIDTSVPDGVEATGGEHCFVVPAAVVMEAQGAA